MSRSIDEAITNQQIIQLFDGNHVTLFDLTKEGLTPVEFTVQMETQLTTIDPNPNITQLVCLKNDQAFSVVNINSLKVIAKGEGQFYWHDYDEYLLINDGTIRLFSIMQKGVMRTFEGEVGLL